MPYIASIMKPWERMSFFRGRARYSRGEIGLGEARNTLKDFLKAEGYDPHKAGLKNRLCQQPDKKDIKNIFFT